MGKDGQDKKRKGTTPQQTKKSPQVTRTQQVEEPLDRLLQRAEMAPHSLTPADAARLQRTVGNQAVGQLGQAGPGREATVSSQESLQRMLANEPGQGGATANVTQRAQGPVVQRYLMNKTQYPYVVIGPAMDETQKQKIANTLILKGELDGFIDLDTQVSFRTQAVRNEEMEEKRQDENYIYVYDKNEETQERELQATYEVSDILNSYNVETACVLQALINVGADTGFNTAKDLHDDLWKNNSQYRLYDLDDVYPALYAAKGLTQHDAENERLDTLVEETLEVGKKYALVAQGIVGTNGHNFCIRVKTVGSGNAIHKAYDLIEDPNNPGGVLDDTRIAEYWSL